MQELHDDRYYVYCSGLFKIYKIADLEVVALRGLDLQVQRGEVMAIIGASGSGKSSLLNILAGYDKPSAGQVWVGGQDLLRIPQRKLITYRREVVGFIWQQTARNLLPYLTALENVEMPMVLRNRPAKERRARAEELLRTVGLAERMQHTPDMLSGGEQQRVAIAVALSNNPPLLLADEPTGELDNQTADEVLDALHEVNRAYGTTIIIVTHDPDVMRKTPRVVTIRDGKTSLELVREPTFQQGADPHPQEYALVDSSGRLQIPQKYLDELRINHRATVEVVDGHVAIWPEERS